VTCALAVRDDATRLQVKNMGRGLDNSHEPGGSTGLGSDLVDQS